MYTAVQAINQCGRGVKAERHSPELFSSPHSTQGRRFTLQLQSRYFVTMSEALGREFFLVIQTCLLVFLLIAKLNLGNRVAKIPTSNIDFWLTGILKWHKCVCSVRHLKVNKTFDKDLHNLGKRCFSTQLIWMPQNAPLHSQDWRRELQPPTTCRVPGWVIAWGTGRHYPICLDAVMAKTRKERNKMRKLQTCGKLFHITATCKTCTVVQCFRTLAPKKCTTPFSSRLKLEGKK